MQLKRHMGNQQKQNYSYPKGKLAGKLVSNTALIAVKLILRALRNPKVSLLCLLNSSTSLNSFMFAVPQTITGKKVSALQAVSIHVEYSRGNNYLLRALLSSSLHALQAYDEGAS